MEIMPNWLRQRAFLTPDRIALETETERLTFGELHERAANLAGGMRAAGATKERHTALLMDNSVEMVVALHALTYIGTPIVLLNTRLSREEWQWQLEDGDAALLIAGAAYKQQLQGAAVPVYTLAELPDGPAESREHFTLGETMTILYTSGTTGKPKGVMHTYGNHWWSAVGSALNLGLREEDCWLACLPLFHVGGLSILLKSVIYGMRIVLLQKFEAAAVNRLIAEKEVTIMSAVAKMLTDMVRELGEGRYPDSLRCMLLGGGPAPLPLLQACTEKSIPVYQTYGMTETSSQICTLSADYMLTKVGSAGKPLFPCELKVLSDGPHIAGEIVARGPNVAPEYYKRGETSADGWLYTGDIGYLDEDGFLYVLDRRSDLIISGGENIYPAQIEEVLLSHPAVAEAGVVGREDAAWGQVPVAFVKLQADVSEEELLSYCRGKLAKYKVPKAVHFVEKLPRNASKKLLRRELKRMIGELP
ncbi:o-succinylbenzoate--CoA ligase [Ectobacillus ponti]|uniref:2-succinylbenzoate--CoA ligase n=1 Tax=Ectobacillus ponti TaxID=2961894 RepID=A0AA42BPI7_9BACI|nr:o-succinylbenzoate--CoA ligase [Ectobacillus ponti]MCP8967584.1 o-succinylbenzoate--CoA ligase [Ectobacillus ponti]